MDTHPTAGLACRPMKVHHLNCATLRPWAGKTLLGPGDATTDAHLPGCMVCHCLLVETSAGLVLVDSGFGLQDVARANERLGRAFVAISRPRLDPAETAAHQVERLGYRREDVRHVVLTHLDLDHAGGLSDFPQARVHLHRRELDAATRPASRKDTMRYRAAQWAHGPDWRPYEADGETWNGLSCVRPLDGVPDDVLLLPLDGHSRGHSGVAIRAAGPGGDGWLVHAGDSYFHRDEIHARPPRCPRGLQLFQRFTQVDGQRRLDNQQRLRDLVDAHPSVTVFSAHDPVEYARLTAAPSAAAAA